VQDDLWRVHGVNLGWLIHCCVYTHRRPGLAWPGGSIFEDEVIQWCITPFLQQVGHCTRTTCGGGGLSLP
jgi:hypothetical protein